MSVFKSTKGLYDYEVHDILGENLKNMVQYGLLELGGYTRVKFDLPNSGYCNLKRVKDDRYGGEGRVYECFGPSLAWESGVNVVPTGLGDIFQVSGVYVNNTFYPTATTSGTYAHIVDYRNARIIFNSSISSTASVKSEYTLRDVDVFLSNSEKWKTIIEEYDNQYDTLGTLSPSGLAAILKDKRVWLPAIAVDIGNISSRPLQLGSLSQYTDVVINYHIISEKPSTTLKIMNLLDNELDTGINIYDINNAPFPYRFNGTLNPSGLDYKQLSNRSSNYFWTYGTVTDSVGIPVASDTDLYIARVTQNIEIQRHLSTF